MADSRIEDLRRRVQQDPASIAFAQLAEELRRAGQYQQAAQVAVAGLAHHPGYISARVTLGRALVELGRVDEADRELQRVLATAPDNLIAIRALADLSVRRGLPARALEHYTAALHLAPGDVELQRLVRDLSSQETRGGDAAASGSGRSTTADRDRAVRVLAVLELWLAAVRVARKRNALGREPKSED